MTRRHDWIQSQKWPVGFGIDSSLELVVRDQGGNNWDGEDTEEDLLGDFPYPRTLKKTTLGR